MRRKGAKRRSVGEGTRSIRATNTARKPTEIPAFIDGISSGFRTLAF